ncbi:ankyrin repeat protein [Leptospira noguchii serovar Panama str. CZ214]|uniref:Ankyrin repeat protein n=1 Tax=Leptospira noguchii serovar Panama str. CZ214 TaxID=1001595 RepID=T0GR52_9LEPT|nr:ankyrin repeat protein [Leptospira noguchii serovar Panama str. CZ214]
MLGAKADPYLETTSGINAAVLATDLCSLPILKILRNYNVDLNRHSKKGFLPIHTAAGRCNGKFLQFLIESGADPEATTKIGTTPLMQAIKLGNLEPVSKLPIKKVKSNDRACEIKRCKIIFRFSFPTN